MTHKEFRKLKVGDKIRIKSIDELNKEFEYVEDCKYKYYDSINIFVKEMEPYAGAIVTIKAIHYKCLRIEEDEGVWNYSYDVIKEKCNVTEVNNKKALYHYFTFLKEAGYNYLTKNTCNDSLYAFISKPYKSSINPDVWLSSDSDTSYHTVGMDERELILENKYLSSDVIYYIGVLIYEMKD